MADRALSGAAGLRVSEANGIATFAFDRESSLNAIDERIFRDLGAQLERVARDQHIRVVVLRGAGVNFSAGADIKEPIQSADELLAFPLERHPAALLWRMAKPTVAAIRGYCLGGALELALATDIRVAAKSSIFGFPEIDWGLTTGWGGSILLARVIGRSAALELVLTGRRLGAEEALRLGLVQTVVSDDSFEDALTTLTAKLSVAPIEAVRSIKRLLGDDSFEADLKTEVEIFATVAHSAEAKERLKLFGKRTIGRP